MTLKELELLKNPIFWLAMGLILVWLAIWQLPDNRLHLVFCDVGQGDAILVSHGLKQVLIDGGPNDKVLECLANNLPFWDRKIETVILTHPEADHLTGLIDVIKRYNVKQFVTNSIANDTAGWWEFYQAVLAEEVGVYSPQAGDKIRLGPMEFLVLWPEEKVGDNWIWSEDARDTFLSHERKKEEYNFPDASVGELRRKFARNGRFASFSSDNTSSSVLGAAAYFGEVNEASIVLQLSYGQFEALLTGDIGFETEKGVNWPEGGQIEVLKVAHHGSKYSTGEEFLERVKPLLAVISVGKNPWGHPTEEVIKKLRNLEIEILRTDQKGEIEIVSDGKKWGVKE